MQSLVCNKPGTMPEFLANTALVTETLGDNGCWIGLDTLSSLLLTLFFESVLTSSGPIRTENGNDSWIIVYATETGKTRLKILRQQKILL